MRRFIFTALALAIMAPCAVAQTGEYPEEPLRLIVPAQPGGGSDAMARVLQREMAGVWPQPVAVVNVPGAGQVVGNQQAKDAAPDGYTAVITHSGMMFSKAIGQASFGIEAFKPVAQLSRQDMVIAVRSDSPHASLEELIEAAKSGPGSVTMGVNIGGVPHVASLMLGKTADTTFRDVQTGAAGTTMTSLLGGHVAAAPFTVAAAKEQHEAGQVRILAVLSPERSKFLPDVPTAREQGVDAVFSVDTWILMPLETPDERVAQLADAIEIAVAAPSFQDAIGGEGITAAFNRGIELNTIIESDRQRIEALATAFGVGGQ